jgi:hypothetical protein
MERAKPLMNNLEKTYLLIDESGDPVFYASGKRCIVDTEGFQPLLMLGMVRIENKPITRKAIMDFMESIKTDPLYNTLSAVADPKGWYLHARSDNLEIRTKFTEFLRALRGLSFTVSLAANAWMSFTRSITVMKVSSTLILSTTF